MSKVFELASGDYLVVSRSGALTIVFRRPYEFSGGLGAVTALRTMTYAVEAALEATAPMDRPGVCRPA